MSIDFINKSEKKHRSKDDYEIIYERLFGLYYDKLVSISFGYIGNKDDAESIVQNVFMKIWEKRYLLDEISNLNNYLFSATKNACLDFLKHKKVVDSFSKNYYEEKIAIQYQFIEDETASAILESELEVRINKAIALLPSKCQSVFVKSRVEGLKHSEIADSLGVSIKTVDNHISNALQHMRLHLKEFLFVILYFF